ncbi:reverse transcriptase domain-containing protein [Tanacetum coccineum]|uniref:Reverse transcriptase domain-containing protein n=1 Tax=Tanacetum coccineum TaxID=301880 RepID=A0ABQ5ILI4_9ASTR
MDRINIDDLTIEQYLRLTQEHLVPSMVKKVDNMTITEYIEYEERIKRQYNRNSGSYFPTYFSHCTSSINTTLEFPCNTYFNPIPPNIKFNYDSKDMELDEEAGYTTDEESVMSEHKAINPVHIVNTRSFKEELSLEEDLDEWLNAKMEKHMSKQKEKNEEDTLITIIKSIREECRVVHKNKQIRVTEADLKKSSEAVEDTVNNDSFTGNFPSLEELNPGSFLFLFTINIYNSHAIANIDASNNVMHRSIYEYLKLANLGGAAMSVKIDDMTQQETLETMKNVLVKINKFEFLCDFVATDMPENLRERIILGRPFVETIYAQIDVFHEEISLRIGEDRIKFDVKGNPYQSDRSIEKIHMANTSQEEESFNPFEIGHDLFSYESLACFQFKQDTKNYYTIDPQNEIARQTNPLLDKGGLTKRWHVCKPVQVFYDGRSGNNYVMWPSYDPDSSFCYGCNEFFGKSEHGMLIQWVCFHDHERRTVKGSYMGFLDFLQVRYENQRIDDTTRYWRYYEWVAQNYEFDNNRTPSTIVSDKCPYKTNHPTPIPPDEWDTRCHITYAGSTSNQNIPNNEPTPFSFEHSELGEKANISESSKLQPFRPCPCNYSFC